jgi:hypothetical protein
MHSFSTRFSILCPLFFFSLAHSRLSVSALPRTPDPVARGGSQQLEKNAIDEEGRRGGREAAVCLIASAVACCCQQPFGWPRGFLRWIVVQVHGGLNRTGKQTTKGKNEEKWATGGGGIRRGLGKGRGRGRMWVFFCCERDKALTAAKELGVA